MPGSLCIVIVNFRTADLTIDCLRSIEAQAHGMGQFHVVVVDNASGDDSVEKLRTNITRNGWANWASVLPLNRNGGFAFGNNAGIHKAMEADPTVDYVLLLNPDTIAHAGAIRTLVDFMDSRPEAGIAGSLLEDAEGAAENSAHNAPSPLGELESGARLGLLSRALQKYVVTPALRSDAHECAWVSGASLIVRRQVFESVGLLDEGYFLYFEEADFCKRARDAGWQIWFVPDSRITHLEGASTGIRSVARRRPPYWYDSRRRYFVKHFGLPGLLMADLLWSTGRATLAFRRALRIGSGGSQQDPKWFAFDLIAGDLRSLLSGKVLGIGKKGGPS